MGKVLLVVCALLFAGLGSADSLYSGEWMFTANGNDSDLQDSITIDAADYFSSGTAMTLEDAIETWLFEVKGLTIETVEFYQKCEAPDASSTADGNGLYITYDSGNQTGTWATYDIENESSGPLVDLYSVKASRKFAFYYLSPALDEGIWSTEHLENGGGQQPDISHFSAYTATPVPEPATFILMAFSMAGPGFFRKRRK